MEACGLVVEYNPFHNGHVYHLEQSRKVSGADCVIAVMSGPFLQRGEPAIIDKFHRAEAALRSGADMVLELPYTFAVQGSTYFADGAVRILNEMGVSSVCFGSESGDISHFISAHQQLQSQQDVFKKTLKTSLNQGMSYPSASKNAYYEAGVDPVGIDLTQPNNILGFSYVQSIMKHNQGIRPLTIKRMKSDYHAQVISHDIASATSIRKELLQHHQLTEAAQHTLPSPMCELLKKYQMEAGLWHAWDAYFSFLRYKVLTMTPEDLRGIHGVDEGLEYRIQKTAKTALTFKDWITRIKTKRYTWTRLQRMFVHILVGAKKRNIQPLLQQQNIPYVRLLGMNLTGRAYLNHQKKLMTAHLITRFPELNHDMLCLDERAQDVYYSILPPEKAHTLFQQDLNGPIIINT